MGGKVWVRDSEYDVGISPVFARWKGLFIIQDCLCKNVYRLRTDPQVSGKHILLPWLCLLKWFMASEGYLSGISYVGGKS